MANRETLSDLIEAARIEADPQDLDAAERREAMVATAQLVGLLRSTKFAVAGTLQATPSSRRGRLRRAWDALRGREPATGWDDNLLLELKATADETADTFRQRLRALEAIEGEPDRSDDTGASTNYRVDEELR